MTPSVPGAALIVHSCRACFLLRVLAGRAPQTARNHQSSVLPVEPWPRRLARHRGGSNARGDEGGERLVGGGLDAVRIGVSPRSPSEQGRVPSGWRCPGGRRAFAL